MEVEGVGQQEQQGDQRDDEEGEEVNGNVEEIRGNAHRRCGEVEDVVGALTLVVGRSNRFSMIFLSSSGCCSSLRWTMGTSKRKSENKIVE